MTESPERLAHKGRITASGAMWFGPREESDIEGAINRAVDAALEIGNASEVPRDYLGGSRLGVECIRALAYEWHEQVRQRARYEADPEGWERRQAVIKFPGRVVRRFRLGHMHEDETADWLRKAGFDLRTAKADGRQFGCHALPDRETGRARIGGHIDGMILGGPVALPYPLLWEHKIMASKKWNAGRDKGLRSEFPVYYAQMQFYMGFSPQFYGNGERIKNALFTALNADTSELWFELVPFNERDFEWAYRRGEEVVTSESPDFFPRISADPAFWKCRFCDYREPCHRQDERPAANTPAWVTGRDLA